MTGICAVASPDFSIPVSMRPLISPNIYNLRDYEVGIGEIGIQCIFGVGKRAYPVAFIFKVELDKAGDGSVAVNDDYLMGFWSDEVCIAFGIHAVQI